MGCGTPFKTTTTKARAPVVLATILPLLNIPQMSLAAEKTSTAGTMSPETPTRNPPHRGTEITRMTEMKT